jgi:hypothetical protein
MTAAVAGDKVRTAQHSMGSDLTESCGEVRLHHQRVTWALKAQHDVAVQALAQAQHGLEVLQVESHICIAVCTCIGSRAGPWTKEGLGPAPESCCAQLNMPSLQQSRYTWGPAWQQLWCCIEPGRAGQAGQAGQARGPTEQCRVKDEDGPKAMRQPELWM